MKPYISLLVTSLILSPVTLADVSQASQPVSALGEEMPVLQKNEPPQKAQWNPLPAPRAAEEKNFTNSIGITFVLIPAGTFMMGTTCRDNPFTEVDEFMVCSGSNNQLPYHKITIAKPFYLAKTELTQGQWVSIMGENNPRYQNPSYFKAEKAGVSPQDAANLPMENISWHNAQTFVQKLNQKEHCTDCYFIPTEAQWEYAARAGTSSEYSFGDNQTALGEFAWFVNNAQGKTHVVGVKKPNQWGLYDMLGNVGEWTCSKYAAYRTVPGAEAQCSNHNTTTNVVWRGGSWRVDANLCKVSLRNYTLPHHASYDVGLRIARQVTPLP